MKDRKAQVSRDRAEDANYGRAWAGGRSRGEVKVVQVPMVREDLSRRAGKVKLVRKSFLHTMDLKLCSSL